MPEVPGRAVAGSGRCLSSGAAAGGLAIVGSEWEVDQKGGTDFNS